MATKAWTVRVVPQGVNGKRGAFYYLGDRLIYTLQAIGEYSDEWVCRHEELGSWRIVHRDRDRAKVESYITGEIVRRFGARTTFLKQ